MKKLLTLATITATILCFGSIKTNEYYTNNGDVQHVRIGSLSANSFVLSGVNLYDVYESKTNAQKNTKMLLDSLNSSDINTSNKINSVINTMTNNFEEVRSDIILLENKINTNYINQSKTNTFLLNGITELELDLNKFKNTYNTNYIYICSKILELNNMDTDITNILNTLNIDIDTLDNSLFELTTNVYTKSEVDNNVSNLTTFIENVNTDVTKSLSELTTNVYTKSEVDNNVSNLTSSIDNVTNSLSELTTNVYTKSEVDNSITNVLFGMVFDISSLEKVQESLNIIILKLGGSVTNNVVVP